VARATYKLTIPSSTRYLEHVRSFVETHGQEAKLSEDAVQQFKIAVDEACTNIIKHAYKGQDAFQLDISIVVESDRFTVTIRDEGDPFRPDMYREPNIFESVKRRQAGGYGVHIMRRLMDRVEYRSRGRVNEVSLTKYRNHDPACNGETTQKP
jgi:serine/threonine-protein kinase RsbW